jgi:predicted nucleic acid-binding protein
LSFYLDTSVIVNLLTPEPLSLRADALARAGSDELVISDFAAAEFSSVIARRVRTGELSPDEGRSALADFDLWSEQATQRVKTTSNDIAQADRYVRRLDLTLPTPDAIHIAIVRRLGASLATFDRGMTLAAELLGVAVVDV